MPSDRPAGIGLPCPRCGFLIPTTLELLLADRPFYCSGCALKITLNKEKSQGAVEAMQTLQEGIAEAERLRRNGTG